MQVGDRPKLHGAGLGQVWRGCGFTKEGNMIRELLSKLEKQKFPKKVSVGDKLSPTENDCADYSA